MRYQLTVDPVCPLQQRVDICNSLLSDKRLTEKLASELFKTFISSKKTEIKTVVFIDTF